jgi:flagellar biosynthetic protein FlhB
MAEHDSGQERTERATPRKQQESRDKGIVPRSRELNTVALLVAGSAGALMLGGGVIASLGDLMRTSFRFDHARATDAAGLTAALGDGFFAAFNALLPLLGLLIVITLVASVAIGGLHFSPKALSFQWERVSPMKGMARMFSAQALMELVKALAKFLLVGAIAVAWLWHEAPAFLALGELPAETGLAEAAHLIGWAFLVVSLGTILIAAVDVPFQLWSHARQLRMTKQEVRDELKETDGKPEVKAQVRRMQREMAQRRMMQEVPKADVIVTNPTHYAVALRYDAGRMRAPRVVAMGADLVALRIRELGREHRVPLFEAPPLARALYFSAELNQEIPEGLYLAVAQVLAYVFQLREARPGAAPKAPGDLPIPPELRRDA